MKTTMLMCCSLIGLLTSVASAADGSNAPGSPAAKPDRGGLPPGPRAAFGRPIALGPDDKPAFDDPPAGFATKRDAIPHGRLEMIEYDSKTVGTKRKLQVYTPPGYLKDNEVAHLWHVDGNGHDATHWKHCLYYFSQKIFR